MGEPVDLSRARKYPDAWWTVLVVDPVALRVLPHLVRRQRVTPDRISLTSLALALAAGGCFLAHAFVVGAVLFELHFVLDCLDGKLARVRGVQNPRGGFVDLACDLVGTAWCFGTLGVAVHGTGLPGTVALLPALLHVVYTWSTLYRSSSGGLAADRDRKGGRQGRRLAPTPYGVDVENVALFVMPLLAQAEWTRAVLWTAVAFFVLATFRNLAATYRLLGR
jgi:phosphatidylglycerophosphate synthase